MEDILTINCVSTALNRLNLKNCVWWSFHRWQKDETFMQHQQLRKLNCILVLVWEEVTCIKYTLRVFSLKGNQCIQSSLKSFFDPVEEGSKFCSFRGGLLLKLQSPSKQIVTFERRGKTTTQFRARKLQIHYWRTHKGQKLTAGGQWDLSSKNIISSICSRFLHMFSSILWALRSDSCTNSLSSARTQSKLH